VDGRPGAFAVLLDRFATERLIVRPAGG